MTGTFSFQSLQYDDGFKLKYRRKWGFLCFENESQLVCRINRIRHESPELVSWQRKRLRGSCCLCKANFLHPRLLNKLRTRFLAHEGFALRKACWEKRRNFACRDLPGLSLPRHALINQILKKTFIVSPISLWILKENIISSIYLSLNHMQLFIHSSVH